MKKSFKIKTLSRILLFCRIICMNSSILKTKRRKIRLISLIFLTEMLQIRTKSRIMLTFQLNNSKNINLSSQNLNKNYTKKVIKILFKSEKNS